MRPGPTLLFRGVCLPTDYSQAGETAFYHALALAKAGRVPLRLLHVDAPNAQSTWDRFPRVRETLTRWLGKAEIISSDDLSEMGLAVRKSLARSQDPAKVILESLQHHPEQLLVLAPRVHQGLGGFFHRSLSNLIIRKSTELTLFVPEGCRPFVHAETGRILLGKILFPIDHRPLPQGLLGLVDGLADLLELDRLTGILLHVGEEPVSTRLPGHRRWHWEKRDTAGETVSVIAELAEREEVDLIAMTTEGRKGLGDFVRGSLTERVLEQARCPVLVIHA